MVGDCSAGSSCDTCTRQPVHADCARALYAWQLDAARSGGGAHTVEAVLVQVHFEADLAAGLQRALQQQRQVLDLAPLPPVRPRVAVGH